MDGAVFLRCISRYGCQAVQYSWECEETTDELNHLVLQLMIFLFLLQWNGALVNSYLHRCGCVSLLIPREANIVPVVAFKVRR